MIAAATTTPNSGNKAIVSHPPKEAISSNSPVKTGSRRNRRAISTPEKQTDTIQPSLNCCPVRISNRHRALVRIFNLSIASIFIFDADP